MCPCNLRGIDPDLKMKKDQHNLMCKVFELEQVTNSYATQTNDPLEGHHLIDEPAYILQTFWCIQGNLKGKHPESGGARWDITCWHQAGDSDA